MLDKNLAAVELFFYRQIVAGHIFFWWIFHGHKFFGGQNRWIGSINNNLCSN